MALKYTIHHDPGDPWDKQALDLAGYQQRLRISRAPFPDQRVDIQALVTERETAITTWTGHHEAPLVCVDGSTGTRSGIRPA